MIIDVYSDLHLDVWKNFIGRSIKADDFLVKDPHLVDVVIIAGDQGNGISWTDYAKRLMGEVYPHAQIITILGNHDYYAKILSKEQYGENELIDTFMDTGRPALYKFPGIGKDLTIATATLWTEFRGYEAFGRIASRAITDFFKIPVLYHSQEPWLILMDRFRKEAEWLKSTQADVIVTHFPPFLESVHSKFAGNQFNPYFVNDMETFVKEQFSVKPQIWIHGHTHSTFDYKIDTIRVVSNPIGYPGENQHIPFRPKRITL